ncbi:MAG: CsiV family protein [Gammaproteobacteria bacterium]|nr:CsiV family protein [Gammaproteobacteria bacterium]
MSVPRLLTHPALLLLLMLSAGSALHAESPPWYRVELVIFEVLNDATGPGPVTAPSLDGALELISTSGETLPYQEVARLSALEGVLGELRANGDYRIVWHGGWSQPLPEQSASRPVHLAGGRDLGLSPQWRGGAREMEGTARVARNSYLHLDLDLVLRTATESAGEPSGYHLVESRRVETGDLHFFDGGRLGIIAAVVEMDKG